MLMPNNKIIEMGWYLVNGNHTIRDTAEKYGISKTYCHFCLNKLKILQEPLYLAVRRVLQYNFDYKHIRGGNATKEKYAKTNNKHE